MKKRLTLMAIMLILVMAACEQTNHDADNNGDTSANEADKADTEEAGENDGKAVEKALLNNYLDLSRTLRPYQTTINTYIEVLNDPEAAAASETSNKDAITAAEEAITALDGITVEDLDEAKTEQFNEALTELKSAYEEYTTALAAEEMDVTAAEDHLTAANEKLSQLFEEAGLHGTNLKKEIS
ncbi:hypothetical protein [Lentibacillus salicampi]|uniref:Lipoprotein n=1 Tax=Lentibacillus salicampi TaxID=175306 RepID=A0A4Y9AHE6_9BACI|nr:hypothetical protein [Lentibacillus salicampi]TFJ94380.1 hypothetical protein E4U82_00225 [Lentibacillus salicampi]